MVEENYVYYRDVTINQSVLALLPVDGQLTQIQTIRVDLPPREDEDSHSPHLPSTFLPMPVGGGGVTEQEAIRQSVTQNDTYINWPSPQSLH